MKQWIAIALLICVILSLCSCLGATRYTVECTDGVERKMTVRQIKKHYDAKPTRDNPKNLVMHADIRGTGTVTSFETERVKIGNNFKGWIWCVKYTVCINNEIKISWNTYLNYPSAVTFYAGDKVSFVIDSGYEFCGDDICVDSNTLIDKEAKAPVELIEK